MLLPTFLKSLFVSYVSTGERSTRLSKVLGNEQSHLGGQYTVHILAVSYVPNEWVLVSLLH
jgi:nucleoporin POM152